MPNFCNARQPDENNMAEREGFDSRYRIENKQVIDSTMCLMFEFGWVSWKVGTYLVRGAIGGCLNSGTGRWLPETGEWRGRRLLSRNALQIIRI